MTNRLHSNFFILLFTGTLLLAGCERPFVEITTPTISITSPNVDIALLQPTVVLRLTASSFRPVERVILNGVDLDLLDDEWSTTVSLNRGINLWIIESIDEDMVSAIDSIYVLRADVSFNAFGPRLPVALGSFSATEIGNGGGLIVTGGSTGLDSRALDGVYQVISSATPWEELNMRLLTGRVGHTATRLPDNRILVAGGATGNNITEVSQLVESVELLDLENASVTQIPVIGDPIRRQSHTANIRVTDFGTILDLYGGVGDITYSTQPRLGTRSDLRSFLFDNDSLFALHPGNGATLGPPSAGHSQTPLEAVGIFQPTRQLYVGARLALNPAEPISFAADYADPRGIVTADFPAPQTLRTDHADAFLAQGLLAFFGGRTNGATDALASVEVFSEQAGRFFEVPFVSSNTPMRRFGHKAVRLSNGTIMVVGGYTETGLGTTTVEVVSFGF